MRALVIYCHPIPSSFTSAVKDVVVEKMEEKGFEVRLTDLYGSGFDPILDADDLTSYLDTSKNFERVEVHVDNVKWCDTLIFVYPTWWYGLPAMIKGWLDRVLLPGIAFHMPNPSVSAIKPGLQHISRLGVFTTCGASRITTWVMGAPGKRLLMRAVRYLCARGSRTVFVAHYKMDSSTMDSRARHLARVESALERLIRE